MDDIFVYVVDLPPGISEAVMPCYDGYTIYINAAIGQAEQQKAYRHALHHIKNDDFNSGKSVQEIECNAHREVV